MTFPDLLTAFFSVEFSVTPSPPNDSSIFFASPGPQPVKRGRSPQADTLALRKPDN